MNMCVASIVHMCALRVKFPNFLFCRTKGASNSLPTGQWHFVGLVYDKTKNVVYYYANGAVIGSVANPPFTTYETFTPLQTGLWLASTPRLHTYMLACQQFYNRILTRQEMDDAAACPWQLPTPLFHWPFDEVYGANDFFGGGVNGKLGPGASLAYFPTGTNSYWTKRAFTMSNNANGYVSHNNSNGELDSPHAITVSFFVALQTSSTPGLVLGWVNSNLTGYTVGVTNYQSTFFNFTVSCRNMDATAYFRVNTSSRDTSLVIRMRQIAFTYQASTGQFIVYNEGEMAALRQMPIGCELDTTGRLFRVGAYSATTSGNNIRFACVQMYRQALNQREIQMISRCPVTGHRAIAAVDFDNWYGLTDVMASPGTVMTNSSGNLATLFRSQAWCWVLPSGAYANYATTPGPQQLTGNGGSFTVMVWGVLNNAVNSQHDIFSVATSQGYTHIILGSNAAGYWRGTLQCSGDTAVTVVSANIGTALWTHVALSFDSAASTLSLFVNGNLAGTATGAVCTTPPTVTAYHFGYAMYGAASTVQTAVNSFRMFNVSMDTTAVQHIFANVPTPVEYAPSQCEYAIHQYTDSLIGGASPQSGTCYQNAYIDQSDCYWRAPSNASSQGFCIDLRDEFEIRSVLTSGSPVANEWITSYLVQCVSGATLNSPETAHNVQNYDPVQPIYFGGNSDKDTIVENRMPYPLRCRTLCVYPNTWNRWQSGRIGLKGCRVKTCSHRLHFNYQNIKYSHQTTSCSVDPLPYPEWPNGMWYYVLEGNDPIGQWYAQLDLGYLAKISRIQTMGSNGLCSTSWVSRFILGYSFDNVNWLLYKQEDGLVYRFNANSDSTSLVDIPLRIPLVTRHLRIIVQAIGPNNAIGLRFNLYGCLVSESDYPFPAVNVTLGNTTVSTVAGALANPLIANTKYPSEIADRKPIRLSALPYSKAGRYLSVISAYTNVGFDICQVSAYNNPTPNLAFKRNVLLAPSAFASSASQTRHLATDGVTVADESIGATGQVCIVGQPKLVTEMPSNDFHRIIATTAGMLKSIPPSQCTGTLIQLELVLRIVQAQVQETMPDIRKCYVQTYRNVSATAFSLKNATSINLYSYSQPIKRVTLEFDQYTGIQVSQGDIFGFHQPPNWVSCGFSFISEEFGWTPGIDAQGPKPFRLPVTMPASGNVSVAGGEIVQSNTFRAQLVRGFVIDPSIDMWIAVDLGMPAPVSRVLVYMAADRYGYSLTNTELRVGNSITGDVTANSRFCDYISALKELDQRTASRPYEMHCLPFAYGRYVILRRRNPGLLPISEILVYLN